jgi:hypothetical protein
MERLHHVTGGHDDDAAAIEDLPFTFPVIPEAGKGKHITVSQTDVVWNLVAVDDIPLIEAIRWNQAPPALEGDAISRLLGTDSMRALIVEYLVFGSFDQFGTRPHRASTISRSHSVARMIGTCCEGAML